MAVKTKKKPMTAKEKSFRAEIREDMRERGLLPPVKKPLNRKKFIREAREEFVSAEFGFDGYLYLCKAISYVMGDFRPTLEAVGVAKLLKVACEISRFSSDLQAQGRESYKVSELYERIKPILDA